MIRKIIKQVTGNSEGVTFTKEDKKLLDDAKLGDVIEIKRINSEKSSTTKEGKK